MNTSCGDNYNGDSDGGGKLWCCRVRKLRRNVLCRCRSPMPFAHNRSA